MRKWIGIGIVVLLGAGAIVALFTNAGNSNGSATGGAKASSVATAAEPGRVSGAFAVGKQEASTSAADSVSTTVPAGGAVAPPVPVGGTAVSKLDTKVVKHATLDLAVRRHHLRSAFASANGIAGFLGGFVASSEESRGLATVTLRVPSDRFEEAMRQLSGLGRVTNRSERGDDVSSTFSDLDARLRNLSAQEGVLQDLMRQAKNIPDTITVQQQLSAVREQIEQLTGQRNLLDDQASFGTITVAMHGGAAPPVQTATRGTVAEAWHDAVDVTLAIFAGTIVVLGAVVPLGLLVLVGFAGWSLVRRRRRTGDVSPAGI